MKILYVEDDLAVASVAKFIFLKTDHHLVFCQTVSDAIQVISKCGKKIDAIFLDLRLPDASGVELIRHLQSMSLSIPVIITSGFYHDHVEEIKPFQDSGKVRLVLHKPFSTDDLLNTLRALEKSLAV